MNIRPQVKVDFGGEGHYKNGVLTVNIDEGAHADITCDIRESAQQLEKHFLKETIDQITCAHTLEHIPAIEIFPTLRYWRTFLKPTGRLLLVVPDMDAIVKDYSEGTISIDVLMAIVFRRTPYQFQSPYMQHTWGWNRYSLTAYLQACGYHRIQSFGSEIYPDAWPFDTPGMEDHPEWGKYHFQNLRMMAYKNEEIQNE